MVLKICKFYICMYIYVYIFLHQVGLCKGKVDNKMLMKVFSHPGHGKSKCYIKHCSQLDLFRFLEDISPLIQEASSAIANTRGVGWLLNSVWVWSCRVLRSLMSSQKWNKLTMIQHLDYEIQYISTLKLKYSCKLKQGHIVILSICKACPALGVCWHQKGRERRLITQVTLSLSRAKINQA